MNIKPTNNARKAAYPTLAALMAMATLSACEPQRTVGKFPEKEPINTQQQKPTKTEPRILVGRRAPAPLLRGAAVPTNIPATPPKPTKEVEYLSPPGAPPAPEDSNKPRQAQRPTHIEPRRLAGKRAPRYNQN